MADVFLVLRNVEYCGWLDMIHYENETICLPKGTAVAIYTTETKYLGEIYRYDGTSYLHTHWLGDLYSDGEKYILMPSGWGEDD
jgi:hypothetical protein